MKRKLLYLDDEKENLSTLRRVLRKNYELDLFSEGQEALKALEKERYPVAIVDQRMPKITGVEFLKEAKKSCPETVGIVLTAFSDFAAMVDGINAGVIYRYLSKPWKEEDLFHAIQQGLESYDLRAENIRLVERLKRSNEILQEEIDTQCNFDLLDRKDQGLASTISLIEKVAKTQSTVLIRGESGVGKEVVARSIHQASSRADKPFVKVNCGALSENLLESELFGHEKGAFTGAISRRIGRFEAADGGTIFLDEIGDISPKLQVSLLRVLQEKEFERVGGSQTISVDVRILAATHQDLETKCKEGEFREDLYYRLNVFPLLVPPLRNRMEDLPALSERLLQRAAERTGLNGAPLTKEALEKLKAYDWPGNIRELENVLERALILSTGGEIEEDDLVLGPGIDREAEGSNTQDITKELLEKTLAEVNGNKVEAARKLGLKRPTLYYHLKRLGLK